MKYCYLTKYFEINIDEDKCIDEYIMVHSDLDRAVLDAVRIINVKKGIDEKDMIWKEFDIKQEGKAETVFHYGYYENGYLQFGVVIISIPFSGYLGL
jgi:hypothetical protein